MSQTPVAPRPRGPLAGVRVLDLSQVISGPVGGRFLADLGADVVKVEPVEGDVIRVLGPFVGDDEIGLYYAWANAGKRSLAIDLRNPRGEALVRQLVLSSDVVLENFRPGVLEKHGLGYEQMQALNPRIIYCSVTGWGLDNVWSTRRAYAALVQAEIGRVDLDAHLRGTAPELGTHIDGDVQPGMLAAGAICAALFQREREGVGQHVDISMAEALLYADEWTGVELTGYDGVPSPRTWDYPVLPVADGTMVTFMGEMDHRVPEVAAALTGEEIPAFETREAAMATLAQLLAVVPDYATLEAKLEPFKVLVAEVRRVIDVADTPWAVDREVFTEVEPGLRLTTKPFRSSTGGVGVRGRAPRVGEHSRAVLGERLGLSDAELDALVDDGVVNGPPTTAS